MNIGVTEISPRAVQRAAEKNFKSGYYCCEALMCTIRDEFKLDVPKEVIAMLNPMKQELLCVRGNCDTEVDQMVLEFPIHADYCFLEIDGRTIFASHGHHHNPKNPPMLKKGDILVNGHTHIPANEDMGDFIYMNPGSVSNPKEGSAHGYMICESGEFTWKDLEGNIVGI